MIEIEVALLAVHASTDEEPAGIVVGSAVSVQVGAGGGGITVTVAVHVLVPPLPVTVAIYVVVTAGVTDREPEATGVTAPIP